MIKKIFFRFVLVLAFLFINANNTNAFSDDPRISVMSSNNSTKGVLQFSSNEQVKIKVSSYKTAGTGKITVYKSNYDQVLKYLIHDKDYKQIYPNVDLKDKEIVSTFENIDFNDKDGSQLELPLDKAGVWIAQAQMGDYTDTAFIIRNTYGALSKESKDNIRVWGQNFSDRKILQNATVKLYNLNGFSKILSTTTLDGDGVASLPLTIEADIATVETNGEIAIIPLNETTLNTYFWTSYTQNNPSNIFFPFTDRPIYKPGDTVYFKTIIRNDDDARYSIPSGQVSVEAYTGYDKTKTVVYNQTLNIDSQGNLSGQFKLPNDASVGYYSIVFQDTKFDNGLRRFSDSISFQVENYRKPETLISSTTKKNELTRGDQIDINVTGQLFSGQPLPNIKVNYKIQRAFSFDSEYYYPLTDYYRAWYGDTIDQGTIDLDAKGNGKLTIPTDKFDSTGRDQIFTVEFTYVDFTGNTSASANNFYIHAGRLSLYRTDEYYWSGKVNQQYTIPLILKSTSGESLKKNATVKVERKWWEEKYDKDKKYPSYESHSETLPETKINFDSSGNSAIIFTPSKTGSYIFTVETTDSKNNQIIKNFYLWVNDSLWYRESPQSYSSLSVAADKKTYTPGDTAKIQINSSIPDRDIFLSVDRGYMDRYQIVHLTGNQATVDIPLTDHDMPNVYISVSSFGDEQLDMDSTNITVSPQKMKLNITATTDKAKYGPGEEVTVNLTTTDISGNPVSANLALWTIDKAIFELADKNYGDVFNNFWSERYNGTVTSNSLQGIRINESAEKGGCFLPDTLITLANGTLKKISDIKVGDKILTKKNPDSNKLVTDIVKEVKVAKESSYLIINGKLRVTSDHIIYLNGNWHTAGSAQIGDTLIDQSSSLVKIFSIEHVYNTNQVYNLSLEKYHTFFADNFWVHNDKGGGGRENFNDTAYWNPSINTDSNGRAQVRFKLPDNLTTWQISVIGSSLDTKLGEAYSDIKVQKDLVIRPILPNLLRQGDSFNLSAIVHNFTDIDRKVTVSLISPELDIQSNSQNINLPANSFQQIYWPVKTNKTKQNAVLSYSVKEKNGLNDTIIQKIDVLPQGYWQQNYYQSFVGNNTFNFSLPSKSNLDLSTVKLDLSPSLLGSLTSSMEYLIDYPYGCTEQTTSRLAPLILVKYNKKLFSKAVQGKDLDQMLTAGVSRLKELQNIDGGWSWWHGNSDPFVTAYVAKNLYQLKQVGINVPEDLINKTIAYFKTLPSNDPMANYGLSYLSPNGIKPITEKLDTLTDDYLALTVITNIRLGDNNPVTNGLDLLVSRANHEGQTLYWDAGAIDRFGSIEASTALAAQALIIGKSELSPSAVMYLNNHREYGYWYNSFATVQAISAIVNYSVDHNDTTPNYNYIVKIDGQKITSGNVNSINTVIPQITIDLKKYKNSKNITIEKTGSGEIYSNLTSKFWIEDNQSAEIDNGIKITRSYYNHKGKEYNIVPGDLVDVVLNISYDQTINYGVIEDHLPSGLIPVNVHLDNESVNSERRNYWQNYNIEYTKDGVVIPIHRLNNRTFTYLARAINSGDFTAPPALVSLMYNPSVYGQSGFTNLTIETDVKVNPLINNSFTITNKSTNKISWLIGLIISPIMFIFINKKVIPNVKNKINSWRHPGN